MEWAKKVVSWISWDQWLLSFDLIVSIMIESRHSKRELDKGKDSMLKMIRRIKLFTLVVIISLIAAQSMAEIKADSLILGLLFEGNAKDVSGSGVDGKVEGGAKFVAG